MPSGFGFEPRSPTYGPFLVLGLFDTEAHNLDKANWHWLAAGCYW